jgi:hypothetical protein
MIANVHFIGFHASQCPSQFQVVQQPGIFQEKDAEKKRRCIQIESMTISACTGVDFYAEGERAMLRS